MNTSKPDNMKPTRDWLVGHFLGGPEISDLGAAAVVNRMLENGGAIDSSNMHGLAVVAGHKLGLISGADVEAWIAADKACSWFHAKATGIKNAQASGSHGALEEFPFLCAVASGFESARANIGSRVRFVRETDVFKTGRCRTAANRWPSRLVKHDYFDPVARALAGGKLKRDEQTSVQEAGWFLTSLFPDLHALADCSPMVRWYEPVTVRRTDTLLHSSANLPRKKGMEATWSIYSDRKGNIVQRNVEREIAGDWVEVFRTPERLD